MKKKSSSLTLTKSYKNFYTTFGPRAIEVLIEGLINSHIINNNYELMACTMEFMIKIDKALKKDFKINKIQRKRFWIIIIDFIRLHFKIPSKELLELKEK